MRRKPGDECGVDRTFCCFFGVVFGEARGLFHAGRGFRNAGDEATVASGRFFCFFFLFFFVVAFFCAASPDACFPLPSDCVACVSSSNSDASLASSVMDCATVRGPLTASVHRYAHDLSNVSSEQKSKYTVALPARTHSHTCVRGSTAADLGDAAAEADAAAAMPSPPSMTMEMTAAAARDDLLSVVRRRTSGATAADAPWMLGILPSSKLMTQDAPSGPRPLPLRSRPFFDRGDVSPPFPSPFASISSFASASTSATPVLSTASSWNTMKSPTCASIDRDSGRSSCTCGGQLMEWR